MLRIAPMLRHLTPEQIIRAIEDDLAKITGDWIVPLIRGGATAPAFAATVNRGNGLLPATLDASLTAPTNTTTIFTAGTSGSKVDEIDLVGVGTTVAGVVNIFLHDGSTYHLIDQVLVTAVTSSTTAIAFKATRTYENLLLKSGDTIRVAGTVAGNQSLVKCSAFGGDF